MFRRASPTHTFQDVADQIRQAIVDDQLKPGDRLPAGRELARTFGVGRSTVLAAFRILEQAGLITMRPGTKGGAYVTFPSMTTITEAFDLLLQRDGASQGELTEFREQLEGPCVYAAAMLSDETALAEVERLFHELEEYSASPDFEWSDFVQREIHLHHAVASLSGNRVSIAVLRAIHSTLSRVIRVAPRDPIDLVLADWREMLKAIREHRASEAEQLMKQHIARI